MTTTINLEQMLNWGASKRVRTSKGLRDMLQATPTEAFSKLWKSEAKAMLQAAGIGWLKDQDTGVWSVVWWRPIPEGEQQATADTLSASKATDADVVIPANKGLEYLGYQKAGIQFALGRAGTLIADEMGLGKTIQAIGLVNADASVKRVLVVCPASLRINWKRELTKWLTRNLTIGAVTDGKNWPDTDIVLINYELLSKHEGNVTGTEWDLAVVDESHRVKNDKAACTKVFAQIKAKRRVAMTGTPILNRPNELFTSLLWLDPKRWTYTDKQGKTRSKKFSFEVRYCDGHRGQFGWYNEGATHLDELQEVLRSSCMIRRLKADVLTELPAKIRSVIELEGDANAKRAAKAELEKWQGFQAEIAEAEAAVAAAKDQEAYEAAIGQLKEAQGAAFDSMSLVRHETAVAKVPMVLDFVREVLEGETDKVVVFAHHQDVVDALVAGLADFGAVKVYGGMSDKAKQASVDGFQKDAGVRVIVGNIQAMGVGYTLTASSHVVFAELDWTPGKVSQAEDRCHRIGQLSSVLVQHLVLEGSLDAYMAQMIVDKQRVITAALDKDAVKAPAEIKAVVTEITVKVADQLPSGLTEEQAQAAHLAMKMLAGKCDGAQALDDVGFNKLDTEFGHKLADLPVLSPKQAAWAAKLANKYRRQLPKALLDAIKG